MEPQAQDVLQTIYNLGGRIHRWGDGATDGALSDLLKLGLLRFEDANNGNPSYTLTSNGVQAARKVVFAARKKRKIS